MPINAAALVIDSQSLIGCTARIVQIAGVIRAKLPKFVADWLLKANSGLTLQASDSKIMRHLN